MAWPYKFLNQLSDEYKQQRRELLDRYTVYAQLSALLPILIFQLFRLVRWGLRMRQSAETMYTELPNSPIAKQSRNKTTGSITWRWTWAFWWLKTDLYPDWGLRGQWIAGLCWATWLLFLCVHGTGDGE